MLQHAASLQSLKPLPHVGELQGAECVLVRISLSRSLQQGQVSAFSLSNHTPTCTYGFIHPAVCNKQLGAACLSSHAPLHTAVIGTNSDRYT